MNIKSCRCYSFTCVVEVCFIETVEAISGCVPITVTNCEKLMTGVYHVVVGFF